MQTLQPEPPKVRRLMLMAFWQSYTRHQAMAKKLEVILAQC
jgi:hypothetical protein